MLTVDFVMVFHENEWVEVDVAVEMDVRSAKM